MQLGFNGFQKQLQNSNDGMPGMPSHINPMQENLLNHHTHSVNHIAGNKIGK